MVVPNECVCVCAPQFVSIMPSPIERALCNYDQIKFCRIGLEPVTTDMVISALTYSTTHAEPSMTFTM